MFQLGRSCLYCLYCSYRHPVVTGLPVAADHTTIYSYAAIYSYATDTLHGPSTTVTSFGGTLVTPPSVHRRSTSASPTCSVVKWHGSTGSWVTAHRRALQICDACRLLLAGLVLCRLQLGRVVDLAVAAVESTVASGKTNRAKPQALKTRWLNHFMPLM